MFESNYSLFLISFEQVLFNKIDQDFDLGEKCFQKRLSSTESVRIKSGWAQRYWVRPICSLNQISMSVEKCD